MKAIAFTRRSLPLLFLLVAVGPGIAQMNQLAMPFKSTIVYRMLQLDTSVYGANGAEVKLCKELMETAGRRISRSYPRSRIPALDTANAFRVLRMIDSTFTEFGFLFATYPEDVHFSFLTAAFRDEYAGSRNFKNNAYREKFWQQTKRKKHRLIDCDLYSRIYIGIAQMANLPIKLVHIPNHYYVRWYYRPDAYFSWNS